jgi:hypothetical protein
MSDGRPFLFSESLRIAARLLKSVAATFSLAAADDDPLRLNLPPIVGGGAKGLTPDETMLKAMAALYLQAELEQVGIIIVVDVLTDARYQLNIYDKRTAQLLDDFERKRRNWPNRKMRNDIFARVFGLGSMNDQDGVLVNRDFQSKFANFCLELRRSSYDLRWRKTPGPMIESALKQSAIDLLVNLGSRRYGDIQTSTRRIQEQLSYSITVLSDQGMGNALQTRGMWNVLRVVLGQEAPDFARLTTRGQSGMRLLDWLAGKIAVVSGSVPGPMLEINSPAPAWGESWLIATGIDQETAQSPYQLRRAA